MKNLTIVTIIKKNGTTAAVKINDTIYTTALTPIISDMQIGEEFLCTVIYNGNKIIIKKTDSKLDNNISLNIIS